MAIKTKPILTYLADVKPPDTPVGIPEACYRRGVSQALSIACDMVRAGATADDLDIMTGISMEMRYDGKQHLAYLDELRKRHSQAKERFLFENQESE